MPEAHSSRGTIEAERVEGAPYTPLRRRALGQRRKAERPHVRVPDAADPRPLRELPGPAEVRRGGDDREPHVDFFDYGPSDTLDRALDSAADMSGADSERNVVMMSFNWGCDVSTDGGGTWKRLDPSTVFPNTLGGGFWCDQVVIYVPHADLFVWFLQYYADAAGQGAFRIAVADSASVGADPTAWTFWDFRAGDFGFPKSDMDYPDLSYSDRSLYVSTDVMGSGRVVLRMPLEELRAGGTVDYQYTNPDDGKRAWGHHLVQQTTDAGMWTHHEDSSTVRLFTWPDGSGTYSWGDVPVAAWPNGTVMCSGPDGNDWLTKLRDFPGFAVTGGVQRADGTVALAWTASGGQANGAGKDFKQPHVRYVEVDPSTHTTVREIPIWNDDYAFAYPSLARAGDRVGITLGWGGPADHANCAMGVMGDYVVYFIDASTRTITRFGDYITARPAQRHGGFSAFGYWLEAQAGKPTRVTYHPFFTRFG
ncbi:hypothetical protein [Phycicoccus duodecadis]|uniref:Uncharacterized protein n=1 Tax=Phycicoccus duodecadis TaxID=173053 RepID=A0A2N3YMH9_9MICO|nr:hypothetical protein [Phycicoccus duodecadis]PKW28075.1 hypothetical protein ATL31_2930 [Phycicoccus duodecadis]